MLSIKYIQLDKERPAFFGMYAMAELSEREGLSFDELQKKIIEVFSDENLVNLGGAELKFLFRLVDTGLKVGAMLAKEEHDLNEVLLGNLLFTVPGAMESIGKAISETMPRPQTEEKKVKARTSRSRKK